MHAAFNINFHGLQQPLMKHMQCMYSGFCLAYVDEGGGKREDNKLSLSSNLLQNVKTAVITDSISSSAGLHQCSINLVSCFSDRNSRWYISAA